MINILLHSKLDDSGEVSLPAPLTAGLSISVSLATTMGTWLKWSNKPQIWDFCWNSWNNNALFPAGWLSQEKVSLECSHSSHRKEKDQETESESCRHGSLDQPVPTVPSLPGFFFGYIRQKKKILYFCLSQYEWDLCHLQPQISDWCIPQMLPSPKKTFLHLPARTEVPKDFCT